MKNKIIQWNKTIAVLISVTLLVTVIPVSIWSFRVKEAMAVDLSGDDEMKIAADISNMTGVETGKILELKRNGKTWNEILDILKGQKSGESRSDRDERDELLAGNGLEDDYADRLEKEGFTGEEIMEARLLAERVVFQLYELTSEKEGRVRPPEPLANTNEADDITAYLELYKKIDVETAIYLMLMLKKEFGSLEKALDEYLYSLQLGVDLQEYLADKQAYLEQRDEKSAGINPFDLITVQKIEEMAMKKIQEANEKDLDEFKVPEVVGKPQSDSWDVNPMPELPNPSVKNVKPENPADAVMDEINRLKGMYVYE